MPGIVYLLTNEAMPGLVKIGKTTANEPQVRMGQLYTTGVPVPFECVLAKQVDDPQIVERRLHTIFGPNRVNPKREFFKITSGQAIAALGLVTGKNVTPDVNGDNEEISEDERSLSEKSRKRRPNLNFIDMGIPIDSILEYIASELTEGGETAVVTDPKKVRFRDEEMSLIEATKRLTGRENVAPTPYWSFEGRNLNDIYNETYPPDPDSG